MSGHSRSNYGTETIEYAASRGIAEDELPLICNGCSGGLSWLYAIGGRSISCEQCCHCHDIDYQLGGDKEARRDADRRLRQCAARAGFFPPGWKGTLRKIWRWCRSWLMWLAVCVFGRLYWSAANENSGACQ